jgi:hypothetical protein
MLSGILRKKSVRAVLRGGPALINARSVEEGWPRRTARTDSFAFFHSLGRLGIVCSPVVNCSDFGHYLQITGRYPLATVWETQNEGTSAAIRQSEVPEP